MYPIKLGFREAIKRIESLAENGHHAESLVTSVFTIEKTLRRTLKQLIISCGFKSTIADKIINNLHGLTSMKEVWEFYDPNNKKLTEIFEAKDWQIINEGAKMRNQLIHGARVYNLDICKKETTNILSALNNIKEKFEDTYGYSGWLKTAIRKTSKLHIDPKIKTTANT